MKKEVAHSISKVIVKIYFHFVKLLIFLFVLLVARGHAEDKWMRFY